MENPAIIINGKSDTNISSLDRGLQYGDGVFETIAYKKNQLQYWDEHIARLMSGCEVLGIEMPDERLLFKEVGKLICHDKNFVIKIIITRGVGGRGYKPAKGGSTRIIQRFTFPKQPLHFTDQGVNVTLCKFRLAHQSKLARIKHLNRLEQVLARSEWNDEYQEGLVCDINNNIIEATSSNVFFDMKGILVTPDLVRCGVDGVLRNEIIRYCEINKISYKVSDISLDDLENITSMMLCNSVIGVWPVKSFEKRRLKKTIIISKIMSEFNI